MSILNTAEIIVSARRDGLREAAVVVDKFSDHVMAKAQREHRKAENGEGDWARPVRGNAKP